MEADSQMNSPLSQDTLKNCRTWVRDEKMVELCNKVLTEFHLPLFDQKFRFNRNYEIEVF